MKDGERGGQRHREASDPVGAIETGASRMLDYNPRSFRTTQVI